MDHLRRLGNSISIPIPADENAFTGRECPQPDCEGYFKIELGTGLKGEGLPCHCPYCGHTAGHDHFWTKEQIEYAKSVAMRKITDAFHKDLKKLEFDHKPKGAFGIGISMKVKLGRATPIHYYREKQLETEVVCVNCTLRYSVYGVFAFCPDCGQHNSSQILEKNLELAEKETSLAEHAPDDELREYLIADALENVVAAFDGFGRETCRVHAANSVDPAAAKSLSFQNLRGADAKLLKLYGVQLSAQVPPDEWTLSVRCFQKRHLLAHNMGVVDERYAAATQDPNAVVGRKVTISQEEVGDLVAAVRRLGAALSQSLSPL